MMSLTLKISFGCKCIAGRPEWKQGDQLRGNHNSPGSWWWLLDLEWYSRVVLVSYFGGRFSEIWQWTKYCRKERRTQECPSGFWVYQWVGWWWLFLRWVRMEVEQVLQKDQEKLLDWVWAENSLTWTKIFFWTQQVKGLQFIIIPWF